MEFKVEQIAFFPAPNCVPRALALLTELGFNCGKEWVHDVVAARGEVFGRPAAPVGHLAFAYQELAQPLELEVLSYEAGQKNWMQSVPSPAISHIAMHCTSMELDAWHKKLTALDIRVVQTVITESHTNPVIAGKRRYHYVIYGTRGIIGCDLKFIVRYNPDMTPYASAAAED